MREEVATRLHGLLTRILGEDPPVRVRAWDGSELGEAGAPCFVIRDRRALRRLLWKPTELGLARAYIAGELDIEGDFIDALAAVQEIMRRRAGQIRLSSDDKREIVRTAVMLGAVGPEPRPPVEEVNWTRGTARTGAIAGADLTLPARPVLPGGTPSSAQSPPDAVAMHADTLGTAFFERVLGREPTSTCADWSTARSLERAQRDGYERVADRLGLAPGARLLDAACGWGAFAIYVAEQYGVRTVGYTVSREQARYATERVARAGLTEQVEIALGNAETAGSGPYDAIVALTGTERSGRAISSLHRLLRPGGRLLTRQLNRPPASGGTRRGFTARYVFPGDARPDPLATEVSLLEQAGFEIREVIALREHYARTLRAQAGNLQAQWDECVALTSPGQARVWLLYLAASALACAAGRIGLHEIVCVRSAGEEEAAVPAEGQIDVRT
jgi:cyclopropane-fatty-acyl-phospholipid synthase